MTTTVHDPRLREALVTLAKFEAERALLLAQRERDRQTIQSLHHHINSMKAANRRWRRRQVCAPGEAGRHDPEVQRA